MSTSSATTSPSLGTYIRRVLLFGLASLLLAPAVWAQEASSVNVGGQIRERSQLDAKEFNPDASAVDFHELRTRLNVAFTPTPRIETLVQIQDTRRFGAGSGNLSPPTNTIDLHQAYFSVDSLFSKPLSVKVGRQELEYGNQRLIGSVGWHPRGRTFDGAVIGYDTESASVDLFAARLAPGMFATTGVGEGSSNLLGLYSTWAVADGQTLEVFGILDNNSREVQGETQLTRFTPGVNLRGSVSELSYRLEAAYQTGSRGGTSIGAFFVSANGHYTLEAPLSPTVGAGYTNLSGDDPRDDGLGTFNTLFATNHKFYGYMDYFLSNPTPGLQDFHLEGSVSPLDVVDVNMKAHYFTMAEDVVQGSREPYGQELDLTVSYQFAEPARITFGASTFIPGDGFAPDGETAYWAYIMTTINL